MRTARSRTSGENFGDLFMAPSSQELEPPQFPGRFTDPTLQTLIEQGLRQNADIRVALARIKEARAVIR